MGIAATSLILRSLKQQGVRGARAAQRLVGKRRLLNYATVMRGYCVKPIKVEATIAILQRGIN